MTFSPSDLCLKAFLDQSKIAERLISFLPDGIQEKMRGGEKISFNSKNFPQEMQKSLLDSVHYSWFLPTIKSMAKKDAVNFLLALPEKKREKLQEQLKISKIPKKKLLSSAKRYFLSLLTESLLPEDAFLLPLSALPLSPLNVLFTLSKSELVRLIDLLSLFDLKSELRTIVDKKTLQNISQALVFEEKQFLQELLPEKEKISSPSMGLENWNLEADSLHHILHKRGLYRLAKALAPQDFSFLWHIAHRLDIGRGEFILKATHTIPEKEIAKIVEKNVLQAYEFLQKTPSPKKGKKP